ncbi:unnamed protein product [marine sediment metagenome]|uniref:DUF1638 domain-containing protein n=1 Tax=marine sediment metagenome TaxID=412755 RepID=X1AMK1_9ZZZZ
MRNNTSFKGYTIVSCGTLRRELYYLKDIHFLDADKILYTAPGLHEKQTELEKQLVRHLMNAKKYSQRIYLLEELSASLMFPLFLYCPIRLI